MILDLKDFYKIICIPNFFISFTLLVGKKNPEKSGFFYLRLFIKRHICIEPRYF